MTEDTHASVLRDLMGNLPSCSVINGVRLKIMIDGLSPSACVPARLLRMAGRGIMVDFARGWAELRVDEDGFMVQVGFQGGTTNIGAGWDAVVYAESDGLPVLRSVGSPSAARGILSINGNVLRTNFQKWSRI